MGVPRTVGRHCSSMIIDTKVMLTDENGEVLLPSFTIDWEPIQQKNSTKYFGVEIDNHGKNWFLVKGWIQGHLAGFSFL